MRTAIFALLLAACGGSSKSSTTPTAGPTCAAVADAMIAALGEGKESTKAFVDKKQELADIVRARCDADAWTADAKQCLATMRSNADANRCATLLTEAQQNNLARDMDAKLGPPPAEPPPAEPPPAEPAPAAVQPTGAAPPPVVAPDVAPPPPADKAKAKEDGKGKTRKRSAPKPKARPMKDADGVAGDPCDGGE